MHSQLKKIFLVTILSGTFIFCSASEKDTTHHEKKNKNVSLRVVPVLAYAPETRFLFGIGFLTPFKLANDSITKPSLLSCFVAYSQNKQDYLYIPYQFFTKQNKYYVEGEANYYNYSYYYWGIGEQRVLKELYNVLFLKVFANTYRKLLPHFYLGLDYYYEHDMMRGTEPGGALATGHILGSNGGYISGGGPDLLYDTRDSIFFPRHGWFIKATSYFNLTQLGSSWQFGRVVSDISWYHQLARPVVLAINQHNQFSWGTVPFNQLALIGGTKQIRGYYMGYYRDDALSYLQAETRINLIGRVGLDAFGTMAFFGNYQKFPESPTPVFAEGVGLRYNYERKQHINVRLDIGYGNTVEYYLTIQEAF